MQNTILERATFTHRLQRMCNLSFAGEGVSHSQISRMVLVAGLVGVIGFDRPPNRTEHTQVSR